MSSKRGYANLTVPPVRFTLRAACLKRDELRGLCLEMGLLLRKGCFHFGQVVAEAACGDADERDFSRVAPVRQRALAHTEMGSQLSGVDFR